MILVAFLALQAAAPASDDFSRTEVPPTEMIDFLGRRRICTEQSEGGGETSPWLRCASLPAEERAWRARSVGNAAALRWLDLAPRRFRLNEVVVSSWHGPPPAEPRRVEQSGTEYRTGEPYRLLIDSEADGGRSTRITASFANLPIRTFTIDNADIPFLDLQTLRVNLGTQRGRLSVRLRYGDPRGYCAAGDQDDRPELSIVFDREEIHADRQDMANCRGEWTALPDAARR
jgi:hypothetical protein